MHYFGRFDEGALGPHPIFEGHGAGYSHLPLVDHATGSRPHRAQHERARAGWSDSPARARLRGRVLRPAGRAVFTVKGSSYRLGPGDMPP